MLSAEQSALVTARDDGRGSQALPLVVALHPRGGDARSEIARVRSVFGAGPDIVALQAARPCNPTQSNLRAVPEYAGFSWYLGADVSRPEAASFGDALAQVDAFVADLDRPFVFAGDEQGAALAVMLALHAPEGLVGVHATRLASTTIAGWAPPLERLDEIRFAAPGFDLSSELGRAIAARGARVDTGENLPPWFENR